MSLALLSCKSNGAVIPAPSNAIPFMETVSSNTVYHDMFYLEGNSYFFLRVMTPIDGSVTVNGTDSIGFTTNYQPMGAFSYAVEFSVGDLPSGTVIEIIYGPYTTYYIEVE